MVQKSILLKILIERCDAAVERSGIVAPIDGNRAIYVHRSAQTALALTGAPSVSGQELG